MDLGSDPLAAGFFAGGKNPRGKALGFTALAFDTGHCGGGDNGGRPFF
jgi:hypothetical protein